MELRNPYPNVISPSRITYGGNQMASSKKAIRRCGCGIVAAADLLLYFFKFHSGCDMPTLKNMPRTLTPAFENYMRFIDSLRRRYLPIVYPFGMNGLMLAFGLNRLLRRNRIPYRAKWNFRKAALYEKIEEMLAADIPVILEIGPNFPLLLSQKHKVSFYRKGEDGFYPSTSINSHYVTVTGMDDEWMHISSWGREYYINRNEYTEYAGKYSRFFLTNVLYVYRKQR